MKSRIHIIGIGDDGLDGLSPYSKDLLDAAEVVIGSPNLLEWYQVSTQNSSGLEATCRN